MSYTEALARARSLAGHLERRGVRVSIEIQQGRPGTPNESWWDGRFIGSCGHHIVSSRSQGLTPGLRLVKVGRTDVPGPLCNGYGGFDLVARIICMGWANHPGAGGPLTLPGGTIPEDGARPYLFGWEFEGGIVEADWTPAMREFMGKCHAATLDWLDRDERSHVEHKTWAPDRKIDRLNYTRAEAQAELKPHLIIEEDDVSVADARTAIAQMFAEAAGRSTAAGRDLSDHLRKIVGVDAMSLKSDYLSPGVAEWAAARGWGPTALRYLIEQATAHAIDGRNDARANAVKLAAVEKLLIEALAADPTNPLTEERLRVVLREEVDAALKAGVDVRVDIDVPGVEGDPA